jgi:hypothetical protein
VVATPFLDFKVIKQKVGILRIAEHAGLTLKPAGQGKYRCECPVHKGDKRGIAIDAQELDQDGIPGVFKCHASGEPGGDAIGLYAHVTGKRQYAAAKELAEAFKVFADTSKEVQKPEEREKGSSEERGFRELPYLQPEHPSVTALGIPPEIAKALGLGYSPRGHHKQRVAVPLRLADGQLVGYISLGGDVLLPPKWHL